MKKWMKHILQGYLFIAPLLIGCLIFYVIPFGMIFYYSFRKSMAKNSSFVWFDHYLALLKNKMFLTACWNTCRFLVIGIPLILIISYLIALLLRKQTEHYQILKSVLLFPYIMPIVGTVLLVELLFGEYGLMSYFLFAFSIPARDYLDSCFFMFGSFWGRVSA